MATIVIERKSKCAGYSIGFDVYVMNTYIGELKNGGVLSANVEVGTQILFFKPRNNHPFLYGKIPETTFNAVVNYDNEVVNILAKMNMNNELKVSYADNAPHIPTYGNSYAQSGLLSPPFENTYSGGTPCPRCGSYNLQPITEVSSTGKDFNASDACCGYLLCGPLGLLCGASGKGKQIKSETFWLCSNCGNKFKK